MHSAFRKNIWWALAGIVLALIRLTFVPSRMPEAFEALIDQKVEFEGTVVTIPDQREVNQKLTVDISRSGEQLRILVTTSLYPSVHVGDIVRVSGTIKKPAPFDTDGGRTFAYDQFLRKDGIWAVMPIARTDVTGRSRSVWLRFLHILESLKRVLARSLEISLPEPESSLAVGILVGGKQGLGTRLINDFTKSGMLQIIVLSGFNVMIVAGAILYLLRRFPKRVAFFASVGSIFSFVLMSGANSSAIRAGLMAGFALAARTFGRSNDIVRIVCISLFLIALWNPLTLAFDPGFQFSFIATIGLIVGTPLIAPRLLFLRSVVLIELVSTTLAAELTLLPLLLYETGNLSFVSVAANVLSMPVIPFAMAASAGAAALALPLQHVSSELPLVIGFPAYLPLAYVIRIATLSASLPFANRILPAFPFWLVLVSYAALAALTYVLSNRSARPPHPKSAAQQRSNSGYRRTHQHTTSSPTVCNPPYTHAPRDRAQAV